MRKPCILLGVSGGIAAYKSIQLVSDLMKKDYRVRVILTKHAEEFVTPLSFETLSREPVWTEMFDRTKSHASVHHIELAKEADLVLLAPATANLIAKAACGIADDMLTSTLLASRAPLLIAPAMNTNMLHHPATQANLRLLEERGARIIRSDEGLLACGDQGDGKLASLERILSEVDAALRLKDTGNEHLFRGKKVLVTAGPTIESIDPVRFLSNHSSGKMGYAIAEAALRMGAEVTLITGRTSITPPQGARIVPVLSAEDMFEAVKTELPSCDYLIKAAAVADYTPAEVSGRKMKKGEGDLTLPLKRTKDILSYVASHKKAETIVCGFAMETENLLLNAEKKRKKKQLDMLIANTIGEEGEGFRSDTNRIHILTGEGTETLPKASKKLLAYDILERLGTLGERKREDALNN